MTIFFTRQDKADKTILPIVISVHDMTMKVGQTAENFISISNPKAEVEYQYNEDIVSIKGNSIRALSAGKCEVQVWAEYEESKASESFSVVVERESTTYSINVVAGGVFEEDTLYLHDKICQFTISLYDENDRPIKNPTCEFFCQDNHSKLYYEMNQFLLMANDNTKFTIIYPKYNLKIELQVIVNSTEGE